MPISLVDLITRRLILVSGKGGVGKTSVAVLLGLLASSRGLKTLIVEMNASGRVADLFGKALPPDKIITLKANLETTNVTPRGCFEEYMLRQIKFKTIFNALFSNRFMANFLEAVPGLNEILMLGKIVDLAREDTEDKYDLVIVDAPATGHGLSVLEVPLAVEKIVKVGPMRAQALDILSMLGNRRKTALCLVTLAEEMPVMETKEYVEAIKKMDIVGLGPLFINQLVSDIPDVECIKSEKSDLGKLAVYLDYHRLTRRRAELNKEYLKIIEREFSELECLELPFLYEGIAEASAFHPLLKILESKFS